MGLFVFWYVVFIHVVLLCVFEIRSSSSVPVSHPPAVSVFVFVFMLPMYPVVSTCSPSLYSLMFVPSYVSVT